MRQKYFLKNAFYVSKSIKKYNYQKYKKKSLKRDFLVFINIAF